MKKKPIARKKTAPAKRSGVTKAKPDGLTPLVTEVRHLIQAARGGVVSVVNTFQVMTNFEIGRRIVEHEQKGEKRAAYGAEVVKELSTRLTEEFGRGFSKANLEYMRRFYLEWQSRVPALAQTSSGQLMPNEIGQKPSDKLEIAQTASGQFGTIPFTLSWSHYVEVMGIKDPNERSFYEIESRQSDWNVRELKRQKASALYHRLALSRDKAGVKRLAMRSGDRGLRKKVSDDTEEPANPTPTPRRTTPDRGQGGATDGLGGRVGNATRHFLRHR